MSCKNYEISNFEGAFDFLLSRPENFSEDKKYPVVIFLHGAGTRGPAISVLENNYCWKAIVKNVGEECIVAAPHCVVVDWNEIMPSVIKFCEYVAALPGADTSRIYLTGNSMGGYGSWELSILRPHIFAAVAPLCGGGMAWNTGRLKNMPIWAFHGELDRVVDPNESKRMVEGVNRNGGDAKITLFPTLEHNCWTTVYGGMPEFYEWLLAQRKGAPKSANAELTGEIYG